MGFTGGCLAAAVWWGMRSPEGGLVARGGRRTTYAVLASWDPARPELRAPVLAAMRGIGGLVALG